jgi:hypothetical protein
MTASTRSEPAKAPTRQETPAWTFRHLELGWWSLVFFLTLGIILEGLHGIKAGFYLDVSNQTRRLMWTLAHAHGAALALVHIAFASTLSWLPGWDARDRAFASACLIGAGILVPAGFFLGGLVLHGGDPGLGILLVPLGALLLLVAGVLTTRALRARRKLQASGKSR